MPVGLRLPAHADDDAVGRLLGLHLDDAVARAGEVRDVAALRDRRRRDRSPRSGRASRAPRHGPVSRATARSASRFARARARRFESGSCQASTSLPDEHVEGDEASGDLRRQLVDAALGRVEPRLHRVEVEDAVALDHDLAVERRERRQQLLERPQLGEVAEQRTRVPRPEPQLAGAVLEQAAEAVPLRLVLPLVALGQLAHELGLHRRERDRRVRDRRAARPARGGRCAIEPWLQATTLSCSCVASSSPVSERSRPSGSTRSRRGTRPWRDAAASTGSAPSTRATSPCASPPRSRASSRKPSSARRTRAGSSATSCSPSRRRVRPGRTRVWKASIRRAPGSSSAPRSAA